MSTKIAFITGATSGIGRATAILLADQGIHLILCGRRKDRLKELESQLSKKTKIATLSFDIRNQEEVENAFSSLSTEWKNIDILINNAGNAHGLTPIQNGVVSDWENMIDLNIKGVLYISRLVIPIMVEAKKGHVINIGSIAGKEVYPNGNVYSATKHAIDALTKSMRIDLNPFGIKVTGIHPGLVETEFSIVRFKGDKEKAAQVYQGCEPLTPENIAESIWFVINQPTHVVIADLTILPTAQASATLVNRK